MVIFILELCFCKLKQFRACDCLSLQSWLCQLSAPGNENENDNDNKKEDNKNEN